MLQAEVQADPQEVLVPEDPEEGGINSPFFFKKIIPNPHFFRYYSQTTLSLHEIILFALLSYFIVLK